LYLQLRGKIADLDPCVLLIFLSYFLKIIINQIIKEIISKIVDKLVTFYYLDSLEYALSSFSALPEQRCKGDPLLKLSLHLPRCVFAYIHMDIWRFVLF
jgi:hypothetical protein